MKDHQFSIPQTRLILMGVCLIAMQVLFYAAGVATGVLIAPGSRTAEKEILAKTPALAPPKVEAPKLIAPKLDAPKIEPVKTDVATLGPANASPAAAASTEKSAPPATASTQPQEDDTRVLAIQVASFRTRDSARNFAEVLRRSGFSPVIVGQLDRDDATWHYVRLGPYRDWDEAARISAEVDRSYDLHTYIRFVRVSN